MRTHEDHRGVARLVTSHPLTVGNVGGTSHDSADADMEEPHVGAEGTRGPAPRCVPWLPEIPCQGRSQGKDLPSPSSEIRARQRVHLGIHLHSTVPPEARSLDVTLPKSS